MEMRPPPPEWGLAEHAAVALPEPPEPLLPAPIPRADWVGEKLARQATPPPPPTPAFVIPPADWRAEEAERARAEREEAERARTELVQEELERLAEHERADPAPKKRRWYA